jgi:hypothetical protein
VPNATGLNAIAERLFARHNRDHRPDGQLCPSMSVGDVIVIGEDPDDLIVARPWRIVVKEPTPNLGLDL